MRIHNPQITGRYQLNLNLLIQQIPTNTSYIEYSIVTSNRSYTQDWHNGAEEAMTYGFDGSMSVLADMDANDTAFCFVHQASGDQVTDISNKTHFSGYLI